MFAKKSIFTHPCLNCFTSLVPKWTLILAKTLTNEAETLIKEFECSMYSMLTLSDAKMSADRSSSSVWVLFVLVARVVIGSLILSQPGGGWSWRCLPDPLAAGVVPGVADLGEDEEQNDQRDGNHHGNNNWHRYVLIQNLEIEMSY